MICRKCKKEVSDKNIFCPYCGEQLRVISYDKKLYNSAHRAIKETRVMGILECIYLLSSIIVNIIISCTWNDKVTTEGTAFTSIIFNLLLAIPELVFFISLMTRAKAVKYHTSINILWLTLAYPIVYGLGFVIVILLFVNAYVWSYEFYIVLSVLDALCVSAFIALSFILSYRIKKTLHK